MNTKYGDLYKKSGYEEDLKTIDISRELQKHNYFPTEKKVYAKQKKKKNIYWYKKEGIVIILIIIFLIYKSFNSLYYKFWISFEENNIENYSEIISNTNYLLNNSNKNLECYRKQSLRESQNKKVKIGFCK